jgi:hypothetical protein
MFDDFRRIMLPFFTGGFVTDLRDASACLQYSGQ